MDIMQIIELAGVDSTLGHHHVKHGTDTFKTLEPAVLAARIRGQRDSHVDEDTGKAESRAAALLYAHYCADSMDEAFELLRKYLELLDSGQRPLMPPSWRPPVPA
jgi:hypothetical protein